MTLEYWHVLKDKNIGKVGIYYTDSLDRESFFEEFDTDIEDKVEIPLQEADAETLRDILSNMLEDANRHAFVKVPEIILEALIVNSVEEDYQAGIMYSILMNMYEEGII